MSQVQVDHLRAKEIPERAGKTLRYRLTAGAFLVLLYFIVVFLIPRPEAVTPEGWRLFAVFVATVGGLMLQPIPGGALVLVAVTLVSVIGGVTIQTALGGFGDPTVWLVIAAFVISDALLKTGLARRIALMFVRAFGKSSLGVSYALSLTDMVLASVIPSNGARSGGVVLPIARSITELYGSHPGPTAGVLGAFLMTAVYQNICVTAAMFLTGQASNPLAAKIAEDAFGYPVSWLGWLAAGIIPGMCSLLVGPLLIYKLHPPTVTKTPEAAAFAAEELRKMGRMNRGQTIVALVFVSVCGLWATTPFHGLDIAVPALLGSCVLLLTGVLTWHDVTSNRIAWDIFIWYGGLVQLGKMLNNTGVTTEFAKAVGATFAGAHWYVLFAIALGVYFYAHYGFASITAHILSMFGPFTAVLLARDAPVGLVFFAFACFTNLAAGLTNYGTTPSPMFFATGYVSFARWWKIGFIISVANILIWSTIGFAWWKAIGVW
ncbi:MAG: DASS family sodium-coupled anion symporter [Bryobacteraceae bacterium]